MKVWKHGNRTIRNRNGNVESWESARATWLTAWSSWNLSCWPVVPVPLTPHWLPCQTWRRRLDGLPTVSGTRSDRNDKPRLFSCSQWSAESKLHQLPEKEQCIIRWHIRSYDKMFVPIINPRCTLIDQEWDLVLRQLVKYHLGDFFFNLYIIVAGVYYIIHT